MFLKFLILSITLHTIYVHGANILLFFPSTSPSYLVVGHSLMQELANRGHNVTVVSSFSAKSQNKIENYRDVTIELSPRQKEMMTNLTKQQPSFKMLAITLELSVDVANQTYYSKEFQKIIAEDTYDLVILGLFFNHYQIGIAEHFKCPIILLNTVRPFQYFNNLLGNPIGASFVPHGILNANGPMTFKQRLINLGITAGETVISYQLEKQMQKFYDLTFGDQANFRSFDEMKKNISLGLVNCYFTQNGVRPYVQSIIEIGGIQVKDKPDRLPEDIHKWIVSNENGVIYFSLGTNIKSGHLGTEKISQIVKTLGKFKENVLWAFDIELENLPKNIMIKKWAPQDDILAQPNVKLFVTHGGLGSINEAKYHGIPLVLLPVFGDQISNAANVESEGWGVTILSEDLSEETLTSAMHEVLENPKYRQNIETYSKLYRDRPMSSRETAVFWIEYVIRHRGAKHLQSPAIHLNAFQYNSIDTIGTIIAVIAFTIWLVKKFITLVYKYIKIKVVKVKVA